MRGRRATSVAGWHLSLVPGWGRPAADRCGRRGLLTAPCAALGDEPLQVGVLQQWQLTLYGSMWGPVDIRDRQRLIESAMSGRYLHDGFALPCPPRLKIPEEDGYTITPNTLKTLVLVGCFTVFWTVYYMLEVYLSQRSVVFTPGCRTGPCHWPRHNRKPREEGTELESAPLCSSGDADGAEAAGAGAPAAPDLPHEGAWSPSQHSGALGCPHQHQAPAPTQGKEEVC